MLLTPSSVKIQAKQNRASTQACPLLKFPPATALTESRQHWLEIHHNRRVRGAGRFIPPKTNQSDEISEKSIPKIGPPTRWRKLPEQTVCNQAITKKCSRGNQRRPTAVSSGEIGDDPVAEHERGHLHKSAAIQTIV